MSLLPQWPFAFKTLGENHGNQRVLGKRASEFLKEMVHGRKQGTAAIKYVLLLACVPG